MYIITKKFVGYPFSHRQHTHDGHCSQIHGHNWDFEITLGAGALDENGFVYDFGKFGWLKIWLEERFDHTCLINEDDPELGRYTELHEQGLMNLVIVESCSSEGIAEMVYQRIQEQLNYEKEQFFIKKEKGSIPEKKFFRRVDLLSVTVYEDHKNSATYQE